jgi:hypothetical protein
LTNIAIHALNALLAFGMLRAVLRLATAAGVPRLAGREHWIALAVAGTWALHPINFMAVLFVVQRMESLAHTFVFAGLWLYAAGRARQLRGEHGWAQVLSGLVPCTLLGILCKESAALLPLYAFCIEILLPRFTTRDGRRHHVLAAMFGVGLFLPMLAATWHYLAIALQPGTFVHRDFTLFQRLLTELRVLVDYLQWTVFPRLSELSIYHDDYPLSNGWLSPWTTLAAGLFWLVVALAIWFGRRRRPLAALGGLWFMAAHLLTATIIPLELVFEHRNYFASIGVCLALVDLLVLAPSTLARRQLGIAAIASFAAFCLATTWARSNEWDTPFRFAASEVLKHPQSPRATYELARLLIIATKYAPASPLYPAAEHAVETARKVPGSSILPDQALLILRARYGKPVDPSLWNDVRGKLQAHPPTYQDQAALNALVQCVERKQCDFPRDELIATFGVALEHGDDPELLNIYGRYAVNVLDDPGLAYRLWKEAVRLSPGDAQYRMNLILLLTEAGRYDEGLLEAERLDQAGKLGQNTVAARQLRETLCEHAAQRGVRLKRAVDCIASAPPPGAALKKL